MKLDSFAIGFGIMLFGPIILVLAFPEWPALKIFAVEIIFYIPLIIIALVEVNKSKRIDKQEKVKWTLAFIFITFFTAFYYLIAQRKNVISSREAS